MDSDRSPLYRLRLLLVYRDVLRNKVLPLTRLYARRFARCQQRAASSLQHKEKLHVAFLLSTPGMWKCHYLYKEMEQNPRYHPFLVLLPYSMYKGYSHAQVEAMLERTRLFAERQGYDYVIPRDMHTGKWDDIRSTLKPDIVFFSSPYKDVYPQYYIYHFRDTLTCYVPYAFSSLKAYKNNYDLIFHNLVGLYLLEIDWHRQAAADNARCGARNAVVSGYPGTEVFLRGDYNPRDRWKPQPLPMKRVVWAPHHPVDDPTGVATFLTYCHFMLRLANKYSQSVQFAFKPHQLLRFKLSKLWGELRTAEYYDTWNRLPNGQLEESEYIDLFLTSDALIHDSGSFTTEYLFMRKPVMYLLPGQQAAERFNTFGLQAFHCHYHGQSEADIDRFVSNTVLGGDDPLAGIRNAFYGKYLAPNGGSLPSRNIIQIIERKIHTPYSQHES